MTADLLKEYGRVKQPSPYRVTLSCADLRVSEDVERLLSQIFRNANIDAERILMDLYNSGRARVETYANRDIAHTKALQAIDFMQAESAYTSLQIDIERVL